MFRIRLHTKYCVGCFALCVIFCGCRDKNTFYLQGYFNHLKQADFFIYSNDGGLDYIDTLHVVKGHFEWKTPLHHEATFHIIFPNMSELVVFAQPGDAIKMKGDAEQLRATRIEGNQENDLLTSFRLEHLDDQPSQLTDAIEEFIKNDPESRVSNYLQRSLNIKKIQLSTLRIGKNLSDIVLPPDGLSEEKDTIRISKGKPVLFIFWAIWKRESQDDFLQIRRFLREINKEEQNLIRVISISLDTDPKKYFYTCHYDSITWESRCFRQSWDTPIIKEFAIKELPYYVLTDDQLQVKALGKDWKKNIELHARKLIKKD